MAAVDSAVAYSSSDPGQEGEGGLSVVDGDSFPAQGDSLGVAVAASDEVEYGNA